MSESLYISVKYTNYKIINNSNLTDTRNHGTNTNWRDVQAQELDQDQQVIVSC